MLELGIFTLGTISFWIFTIVAFLVIIGCLEYERGDVATFVFIIAGFFLSFFNQFNIFKWIIINWQLTLLFCGIYFLAGTVWAFIKWYFYLHNQKDAYNDAKEEIFRQYNVKSLTEVSNEKLSNWEFDQLRKLSVVPSAKGKKGTILMWMIYWPASTVWTIINDPVRKVFRIIYQKISGGFDKIAKKIFSDVEDVPRPKSVWTEDR